MAHGNPGCIIKVRRNSVCNHINYIFNSLGARGHNVMLVKSLVRDHIDGYVTEKGEGSKGVNVLIYNFNN